MTIRFAPLVLATGNAAKAREIAEIFAEYLAAPICAAALDAAGGTTFGFVVAGPDELAGAVAAIPPVAVAPDVAETGDTLEANALIKARAIAAAIGMRCAADDTGLEVDALGGDPGVHSARYAGPDASDAENCARLQTELDAALRASRTARFVTVVALCGPGEQVPVLVRGKVEGVIVDDARGTGGFGYDPLFAPVGGGGRTFAEMSPGEKHRLSHRGRAFRALAARLAVS